MQQFNVAVTVHARPKTATTDPYCIYVGINSQLNVCMLMLESDVTAILSSLYTVTHISTVLKVLFSKVSSPIEASFGLNNIIKRLVIT